MYKVYRLKVKNNETIIGYEFIIVTGKTLERIGHVNELPWGDNRSPVSCYEYSLDAVSITIIENENENESNTLKYSDIKLDHEMQEDLFECYELFEITDNFLSAQVACRVSNDLKNK